ncbi:MAG: hypothetical protein RLZZ210_1240 [Pseudomonadota bacterium]|jgi:plasmid replication initiation protein
MIDRQVNYTPRIVKKSNILIEHSRKLTLLSYKFFDLLISNVQNLNEADKSSYDIYVSELQKLIGSEKNYQSYGKLKKIIDNLLTEIIELISPKITSFNTTTFISGASLSKKILNIEISKSLKSLIDLNHQHSSDAKTINYGFTSIDLNITSKLKSKYSLALYEYFLKEFKLNTRFQKSKNEYSFNLNLDFLYTFLCNKQSSYKNIDAFKRRILKPALEEINNKTDLKISFEDVKCEFNNKTITGFNFTIQQNEIKQIIVNDIQEIKKEDEIALNPSLDIDLSQYPKQIAEIATIGIKPASKLLSWYNEDKNRLLANWYEINTKYADKSNSEKARLMVYLWKVKANYISPEEIQAKEKELAEKAKQEAEIKQIQIENKNQEENNKLQKTTIRQNNREIFENELKKEDSQLSQVWKAVTKAIELNIPIQQVKTWFTPAIAKIEADTLNIVLPNRFKLDFFKNNLLRYVNQALYNINVNINVKVSL